MFNYANAFNDELIAIYEGKDGFVPFCEKLRDEISQAFRDAAIDGKLNIPAAVEEHAMPLGPAVAALKWSSSTSPELDDFLLWAMRTHLSDIFSMASRLRRTEREISRDDFLARVNAYGESQLTAGNFDMVHHQNTDLVASSWDGIRYHLSFHKWRAEIYKGAHPVIRAPSVRRSIAPAHIPHVIEVEMKLPSGKMIIGSSAPIPALEEIFLEMRRTAPGLSGDIDVTNKILDDHQILALPVHHRSLRVLDANGRTSVIVEDDPDKEYDIEKAQLLLDYRFLTIADEDILQRNIRALPKEANTTMSEALERTHARFEIEPGTYRITLPANYARTLPMRDRGGAAIVALDKMPDR